MLHTISVLFLPVVLTSVLNCDSPYIRDNILKAQSNCGEHQCYCTATTATCVGDGVTDTIPYTNDDITELHAMCYSLINASLQSFININANVSVIYLKENHIQYISRDVFQPFHSLSEVHIEDNTEINITQLWEALGSIQKVNPINLTLNNIGNVNLTEDSFTNINISNVQSLTLTKSRLKEVPISLFNNFTSLQVLNFAHNWIRRINIENAYPIKTLTTLDLQNNRMVLESFTFCRNNNATDGSLFPKLSTLLLNSNSISSGTMSDWKCLTSLKELDLRSNKIKHVNMTAYSELTSLESISFRDNWIQNVTPGVFPPKLKAIDLQQNEMVTFPPMLCEQNSTNSWNNSVMYLNLSGNYIQRIMIQKWDCLQNLISLDLGKNGVSEYRNDTFYPLVSLKHLYLDNMIPDVNYIGHDAFRTKTGSLQTLILRYNHIDFTKTKMQSIFQTCTNVTFLDISYNHFYEMSEKQFVKILSPMKGLRKLKALSVYLQSFPSSVLKTFPSLEYLNINRNHLNTIDFPEEFNDETMELSLNELHVSQCSINTMDDRAFPAAITRSLRTLDVSKNEFACGCKLRWFRDNVNKDGHIFQTQLLNWPRGYECRSPKSLVGNTLKSFQPDEICDPLFVCLMSFGGFLFLLCIIAIIIYRKWWYVKYWWYSLTRRKNDIWMTDPEQVPLLNQIHYDGYIVQDADDDDFVHHAFLDIMEKKLNYKLHVWKRDAKNGALVDVILDGMYAARQTIIIVSNKSIRNQWCKFQVDVAIDRSVHLQKPCVLLVVLDDTDFKHMSKSWCVLLAKTPKAYWSIEGDEDDIKRKLFEQTVLQHFGPPLCKRGCNGHSLN